MKQMLSPCRLITFLALLIALPGCRQLKVLSLEDAIPTAKFRKLELRAVQPQLDGLVIELNLIFEYKNPFNKSLPIPEHEFTFSINDKTLQRTNLEAFRVPAKGSIKQAYPFRIDLTGGNFRRFKSFVGKDNVYEFKSKFVVSLQNFLDELPRYNIALPENEFTEAAKPRLQKYLNEKLGERVFELSHSDTLRIPAFPEIRPSLDNQISVRFLGEMETLNLQPLKDAIVPIGDLMVNGNFTNSMADPFINLMENTEVEIPAPTLTDWDRTKTINLTDYVLDLLKAFDSNVEDKWEALKGKLSPEDQTALMDQLVQVYFSKLDPNAAVLWSDFKSQWNNFVNTPGFEIHYPGPNITGIQVEVPFILKNTNQFPIIAPQMSTAAWVNNLSPIAFSVLPENGQITIGGNQSREMKILLTLNWQAASNGMLALLTGQTFHPNLTGEVSVDLGYGPMKVGIDLQQIMMKFGE